MFLRDFTRWPLAAFPHIVVIAIIQRQMFIAHRRLLHNKREAGIAHETTSLILVGLVLWNTDAQAAAFLASRAYGAKERATKSTPAATQQLFIPVCRQIVRDPIHHPRDSAGQIRTGSL